ncbi:MULTISPECIES: hypothetical protein [unclassified Variovorax]|uniref:hypothetical protein n=1 Tax=unclassified Variovorax TaxID=663243 RepID=UPI003F48030A
MFEYRVTKYDPAVRLNGGTYNEWTSFGDVGATFDGTVLTRATYEKVEAAYISVATAFLREANVGSLVVRGLEYRKKGKPPYAEGGCFTVMDVEAIMAKVLREELWCRLEGDRGFIHFGWDYYMYIGVAPACPEAQELATKVGLFVEEMRSPYHPDVE